MKYAGHENGNAATMITTAKNPITTAAGKQDSHECDTNGIAQNLMG